MVQVKGKKLLGTVPRLKTNIVFQGFRTAGELSEAVMEEENTDSDTFKRYRMSICKTT